MDSAHKKPPIITYGQESPPLLPSPQRLHYQFSAALPQTHLTFVSVLQGVVFGLLLLNIPLPPQNASWLTTFDFSLKQYVYLPYIISSLIIIIIWNQFVHASLFVTWPLSIFQSTLLFLLTMAEILTFGQLKGASLSAWLFGLGWVGILGGIIRLHNTRWYHTRTPPSLRRRGISFRSVVKNFIKRIHNLLIAKSIMNNSEIRDGLCYIGGGIVWIAISQEYGQIVQFVPFFPWIMLVLTIAILCVYILLYKRLHQSYLQELAKDSDLVVSRHGLITYNKELSEKSSEGSTQETVYQQTNLNLSQTLPGQHLGTTNKSSTLQWKRLLRMLHLGFTGLTVCAIGIWILRHYRNPGSNGIRN